MIRFNTLEGISTEEIRLCFNEAFAQYFVPVSFTQAQLEQKLWVEGYAPEYSVGAFDKSGRLAGFILHGSGAWNGKTTAYNCGTGVVAAHRGQQLSLRMYAFILPKLREMGVQQSLLEVIQENGGALRSYQKAGFQTSRELISFKGSLENTATDNEIYPIASPDWPLLQSYWSWTPCWQHSPASLLRAQESYQLWGIEEQGQLVAYAMLNPLTNRIPSFAVAPQWRRQGLASRLFRGLQQRFPDKPLLIINVHDKDAATKAFLQSLGFSTYVKQYEMNLQIS